MKALTSTIKKIRTAHGVREYRLQNGLRVLYRREKSAPVVAVCVTFHVGSRNEAAGHTGATHILEHLLFKDSEKFNKASGNAITDYLEWLGAYLNATTWLDRTNYFEMLPADKLEEALALEADRLRGSQFNGTDLSSEMTVVRNEYERSRNNPFELLDEEVVAAAFTMHPYRIPTIGLKEDIEASTAAKLREFYDTFYWPDNATLTVIGDVPFKTVEKLVLKHFGPIPSSPHTIPRLTVKEPAQKKLRTVRLKKPMGVSIAELLYKAPHGRDKEFLPLYMAVMILAGGFSSRLQKSLVDTGLAAELMSFCHPLHDPGMITFTAHVAGGIAPEQAMSAMRREIAAFAKQGPTQGELSRAKERILANFSVERDGVLNEVRVISEAVAAGNWQLAYRAEAAVKKMTVPAVARAAARYLTPKGETAGILYDQHN